MQENMSLYIDPETRDLVINDEGLMETTYENETIKQAVRLTLMVYKEEFPFDLMHGTDWKQVMGKKPHELNNGEISEVIREGIFQEDSVTEISEIEIDISNRNLNISFSGTLSDGNTINMEVGVNER